MAEMDSSIAVNVERPAASPPEAPATAGSLFEMLLNSAPDAVVIINRDGRITFVNTQTEHLFGYRREELIGQLVEVLIPQRFREGHVGQRNAYIANPQTRPMGAGLDLFGRRKDGTEIPVDISLSPLQTPSETLVFAAIRDVADQRRTRDELRFLARQQAVTAELGREALAGMELFALMDHTASLVTQILSVDCCGIFELEANANVLLLQAGAGWKGELTGRSRIPAKQGSSGGYALLSREPVIVDDFRTETRFQRPDLLANHGILSGASIVIHTPGGPFGVLGVYSKRCRSFSKDDVHFLQAIANVLGAAIERKREEQRQRERDLQRTEQMAALGQVAAGIAHELRNPLTAVKGLVQVNRKEAKSRGLPTEDLEIIEQEIRRMERTLQTFLDFARPQKPERRAVHLASLADRVLTLIAGRALKQHVSLEFKGPGVAVTVQGDQDQIQQLILNLVLNALDVMPKGGALEVELRPPHDGQAELQVRDSGPGIPEEHTIRIFDPFVSTKETGLGLGLAVSRRIAEDHGGSLSAYNRQEGGACFVVRLPAAESDERT